MHISAKSWVIYTHVLIGIAMRVVDSKLMGLDHMFTQLSLIGLMLSAAHAASGSNVHHLWADGPEKRSQPLRFPRAIELCHIILTILSFTL